MHRGRGRGRGAQRGKGSFPLHIGPSRTGKFASTKDDHMPTSISMRQERDERARQAEEAEYRGPPPPGKDLIQVKHVLPGKELLPSGLEDSRALDDIRRQYRVYITCDPPNILDIRCESLPRLQKALDAVNWAVRDMRLSNDSPDVYFLVQKPTNALLNDIIRVELGTRPYFLSPSSVLLSNAKAMDQHLPQLTSEIASSAEGLMALNKTIGLRVNFGHLIVGKRKKGTQDETTYHDFADLMGMYSSRGGAMFQTRLEGEKKPERILQWLVKSKDAVCNGVDEMRRGCEVIVKADGLDIKAEGDFTPGKGVQLAMVRAARTEQWARLNWTVAAPDMQYDWSFRVDAWDQVEVPPQFEDLAKRVSITLKPGDDAFLPIPDVDTAKLASLGEQITGICARSWTTVPFKNSSYALKINTTKTLKGPRTIGEPEVTWGVELYAPHWEESVNYASGGRKDWGKELENIWTDGNDLKSRLGSFMRTILEVQALLNRADAGTTTP